MFRIPGRIPISIHPLFWIFSGVIGWIYSHSLIGVLIWILIIFISVLVHELGHAFTALAFGQNPQIQLVALGGLTSYRGSNLKFWKQFIIVLNGPIFGFLLCGVATLILQTPFAQAGIAFQFFKILQVVNLFWSVVNLIPVLPLDGGQLLRIALEGFFGVRGFKASLFIGMLISIFISIFFFVIQYFLIGALFFLFAFQSFDLWRRSKNLSTSDQNENAKQVLMQAEVALQTGKKEEAKTLFESLREKSHEGIIYVTATQYLALIYFDSGEKHKAFELLKNVEKELSDETLCLLHQLAFEEKDYGLVAKHSSSCYQLSPSQKTALRNAIAYASLKEPKYAGGWLQTAWKYGNLNLKEILNEQAFEAIKKDPVFLHFLEQMNYHE